MQDKVPKYVITRFNSQNIKEYNRIENEKTCEIV